MHLPVNKLLENVKIYQKISTENSKLKLKAMVICCGFQYDTLYIWGVKFDL